MGPKVEIARRAMERWKRQAKEAFPLETFAILLGTMSASSLFYRVEDIWIPEDLQGQCTKTNVFLKDEWWTLAARDAALKDLSVIGDIHSHPARYKGRPDCAPSEDDWHNNLPGHFIHGICVVQKLKNGNLRATTRLWPVIHLPEMWVA